MLIPKGSLFKEVTHKDIQSFELDAGDSALYARIEPEIYGASEEVFKKTIEVYRYGMQSVFQPKVVGIKNATVVGRGIILADFSVLSESLTHYARKPELAGLLRDYHSKTWAMKNQTEISEIINEDNCVLLKMNSDGNYGHWIVEALPRIDLIKKTVGLENCKFIISYITGPMRNVYLDSLHKMGVRQDQLIVTPEIPLLVKNLLYPLPMTTHPWVKHPDIFKSAHTLTNAIVRNKKSFCFDKIFVRRSNGYRRVLENESEIAQIASEYGFIDFWPERASFEEQVKVFSSANFVVGNLGATVANMIYSPSELVFIGFAPEDMYDDFFWDIICHKKGRYISLHGTSLIPGDRNSNFHVDFNNFREILDSL